MRSFKLPLRAVLALGAALLVWTAMPADTGASQPGLNPATISVPSFLAGPALLSAPPAVSTPVMLGLPSSVLPNADPQCSVIAQPNVSIFCSVGGNPTPRRCTTNCNSGAICSAQTTPNSPNGTAGCSTAGGNNNSNYLCSILQPPLNQLGSYCSAIGDFAGLAECSVMGAQPNRRQACTAQNQGSDNNVCSAMVIAPPALARCSVLFGGNTRRHFCSVGNPPDPAVGTKVCTAGRNSECSMMIGSRGACTVFKGAPPGACSALPGTVGHCSIIGGPAGNQCNLP